MKSTDYDERIERAEAQLKKWRAEKKKLATKEAKAAQREAEAKREAELRQKGFEFEDIENWMQSRTITIDGAKMTLWEWYQRERRDAGDDA
jgi:SOS response regulatory protein OraA/RecX